MRQTFPMILIRVIVGLVFLTEGALKFLWPGDLGVGRFVAIGVPYAHLLAPFIGGVEIVAGIAVLLNLFAGDAALLLLVVTVGALVTTKLPILLGHSLGPARARQTFPLRLAELSPRSTPRPLYAVRTVRRARRLRPAHWTASALVPDGNLRAVLLPLPAPVVIHRNGRR